MSVFGSGRKLAVFLLWRESLITTGKKSRLSDGCAIIITTGKKKSLRPEKKSSSCLSGGCVSFCFWREIGIFLCCGGKVLLLPEKKDTVVCLAGGEIFYYDVLCNEFGLVLVKIELIHFEH